MGPSAQPNESALETRLQQLRVASLPQEDVERWYGGRALDGSTALSPQNEAAALTKLLDEQTGSKSQSASVKDALQSLCNSYLSRTRPWPQQQAHTLQPSTHDSAANQTTPTGPLGSDHTPCSTDSPETQLITWANTQGILTTLTPALTNANTDTSAQGSRSAQGAGEQAAASADAGARGMVATRDIAPGQTLVSVPRTCLITYETALKSDFGACLKRIPGLDEQSAAVLWTMVDRHDTDSPWAPFWRALPQAFGTGLGVCGDTLTRGLRGGELGGAVMQEAREARKHIRQQYQSLSGVISALLRAYGQFIKPEHLSWQSYLWAVQLWYAYAIQVQMPSGELQPCLVPVVSLINHSPWPHSVAFSRLDAKTDRLNVRCFRTVGPGEEALLSYGPLPNTHLLLFYGFAVPDNPYDTVTLDLQQHTNTLTNRPPSDSPASPPQPTQHDSGPHAPTSAGQGTDALRARVMDACGLSHVQQVRVSGPLPPSLLATARLLCATDTQIQGLWETCCASSGSASNGAASGRPGSGSASGGAGARKGSGGSSKTGSGKGSKGSKQVKPGSRASSGGPGSAQEKDAGGSSVLRGRLLDRLHTAEQFGPDTEKRAVQLVRDCVRRQVESLQQACTPQDAPGAVQAGDSNGSARAGAGTDHENGTGVCEHGSDVCDDWAYEGESDEQGRAAQSFLAAAQVCRQSLVRGLSRLEELLLG